MDIQEQLKGILDRLNETHARIEKRMDELSFYQREMNGKVTEHSRWIAVKERELDGIDDRFKMLEESADAFQSYMDRRDGVLEEFRAMQ